MNPKAAYSSRSTLNCDRIKDSDTAFYLCNSFGNQTPNNMDIGKQPCMENPRPSFNAGCTNADLGLQQAYVQTMEWYINDVTGPDFNLGAGTGGQNTDQRQTELEAKEKALAGREQAAKEKEAAATAQSEDRQAKGSALAEKQKQIEARQKSVAD
jgi:hypothetical protein